MPMPTSTYRYAIRRVALLLAILIGFSCGPGADEMGEFFSLFQPEAATFASADSRYLFTPQLYKAGYFGVDDAPDSLAAETNTAAWVAYLGAGYPAKLVGDALADTSASNALVDRLTSAKPEAATYLRFAYAAQQATGELSPWTMSQPDTIQLTQLRTQARRLAMATTDPFLKERYAFQAVKLAGEAGQFAQCIADYQQLAASSPTRTFISDWARCRLAGALLLQGEADRAVFEFAQVFANCPTRRLAAERSLRHHNLRFTEKALSFAKTDAERVAVYAICAIQPKQDALHLLEKMVALDPKNPLIELVLAREINRNEYYFAAKQFPGYVDDEATRADSIAFETRRKNVPGYSEQLLAFAEKLAKNAALGNPAFYLTAAAYLHYLDGDYESAKKTLAEAALKPTANTALKQQIALQQLLLLTAQPGLPTATDETELISYLTQFKQASVPDTNAPYITNFRFTNAIQTVGRQLANRYLGHAGDDRPIKWLAFVGCSQKTPFEGDQATYSGPRQAKAFLMRMLTTGNGSAGYSLYDFDAQMALEDSASVETAQSLYNYVRNPLGEFDERLVKLAGVDSTYARLLLGRRALAEARYSIAERALSKVNAAVWQTAPWKTYFTVDPFSVNMPGEGKPRNPYTPAQFAEKMANLFWRATYRKDGDKTAQTWYELGCGAYNLTYYGNAWMLVHRYRSSGEPYTYRYSATDAAHLNQFYTDPYYSVQTARYYFVQAAKLATDPELAAKATYMAARCEANALQTRRVVEIAKTGGYVADDDQLFNEKMRQLAVANYDSCGTIYQRTYRQTQFAQLMQTRCALYRDFIGGE